MFGAGPRVRNETTEEGRKTLWSKCCEYNNEVKNNSPNILTDNIESV